MKGKTKFAIAVSIAALLILIFTLPVLGADGMIQVSDRSKYSREADYLVNVTENTTVETVKESLRSTDRISFTSYDGVALNDSDLVGTGTKIELTENGSAVDTLEIVIKGDVSHDGEISTADYMQVRSYLSGYEFDDVTLKAADVNDDGYISTVDYLRIRYYFAGIYELYDTTDYSEMYLDMTIDELGYDVYQAFTDYRYGYRYGPTILINDDGSYDMWLASIGGFSLEADWITYQHSDDGENWTHEKSVLQPTGNSLDHYSVCDPGVIYFNGYYYIGYTSTTYYKMDGLYNSGYVARSKNPDGPYEKWNGSGWGGNNPVPIVKFDGWEADNGACWGAGELSFVVVDDTLYVYYTWRGLRDNFNQINQTRVSIADATDENWPATMEYQGFALNYSSTDAQDSADFAYIEEYDKWIGVATVRTREDDSSIVVYQSDDGIRFTKVNELNTNVMVGCHNIGISKRLNGHISLDDDLLIGYAYTGPSDSATYIWGKWNTRIQKISIGISESKNTSDKDNSNYKQELVLRSEVSPEPIALTVNSGYNRIDAGKPFQLWRYYKRSIDDGAFKIDLYTTTEAYSQILLTDASGVTYTDYDTSMLQFDGFTCTPLKAGKTSVTAHYQGHQTTFEVEIVASGKPINMENPEIVSFEPVVPEYRIQYSFRELKGITAYVEFEDGNKVELGTDNSRKLYSEEDYPLTYSVSEPGIINIDSEGRITPLVSCNGFSFTVPVTVY